jgi:hypothetical protein
VHCHAPLDGECQARHVLFAHARAGADIVVLVTNNAASTYAWALASGLTQAPQDRLHAVTCVLGHEAECAGLACHAGSLCALRLEKT